MKHMGIQTAILSVTAPGACILEGQASYALARKLNESGAEIRDSNPQKFGFFASLPNLLDTDAALAEIRYAFDVLHADGVTLFTRYGNGNTYLGHADIEPIWTELNRRKCVVFVHPTHPVDTNKVNAKLPQPVIDYPHETTRTAMDMILMGTRRKYPDCKVILSHAGGSLPYLISRLGTPLRATPNFAASAAMGTNYDQAMASFRSFHYDLALSASPQVLDILLKLVPHDHILFGVSILFPNFLRICPFRSFRIPSNYYTYHLQSDFPYAPPPAYPGFLSDLEEYLLSKEMRDRINFGNAHALFPRLVDSRSSI